MAPILPHFVDTLQPEGFRSWLHDQGAEVLETASPYEVFRYRLNNYIQVVYRNEKNRLRWTGETAEHYKAFLEDEPLVGTGPRLKAARRPHVRDQLVQRDGTRCWLCEEEMSFGDPEHPRACTIEHLLPRSQAGGNHKWNLVLCCKECNNKLDDKPLVEKIKLRDTIRQTKNIEAGRVIPYIHKEKPNAPS